MPSLKACIALLILREISVPIAIRPILFSELASPSVSLAATLVLSATFVISVLKLLAPVADVVKDCFIFVVASSIVVIDVREVFTPRVAFTFLCAASRTPRAAE
jgi:hypothetical protein